MTKANCPVCASPEVSVFFEMPAVPVFCNLLWASREAALQTPRGDVALGLCSQCGFIFNLAFDPARLQYRPGYENALHFSPRFQAYAQALAARLVRQYDLRHKDIIEIGCGDGDFLQRLCALGGNRGVGFDPSRATERNHDGITVIGEAYSERHADYPADFICCRHVLEHVAQPREMLTQVRRTIGVRQNIAVFFEVPNALFALRDLGIWDIIYEHCSYFSADSLAHAFRTYGFKVLNVAEAYDGQFLCLEAAPEENTGPFSLPPRAELETIRHYAEILGDNFRRKVEAWRNQLALMLKRGKRVAVWGAGSKGVTFMNTLELREEISCVVDVNPRKQGMFIAGTGQRIVAPEFLRDLRPDAVLVMNPIYADEIRAALQRLHLAPEVMAL